MKILETIALLALALLGCAATVRGETDIVIERPGHDVDLSTNDIRCLHVLAGNFNPSGRVSRIVSESSGHPGWRQFATIWFTLVDSATNTVRQRTLRCSYLPQLKDNTNGYTISGRWAVSNEGSPLGTRLTVQHMDGYLGTVSFGIDADIPDDVAIAVLRVLAPQLRIDETPVTGSATIKTFRTQECVQSMSTNKDGIWVVTGGIMPPADVTGYFIQLKQTDGKWVIVSKKGYIS